MTLLKTFPQDLDGPTFTWYAKAVDTDEHGGGMEVVSNLIRNGVMDLWIYNEEDTILVVVTRFVDYPDGFREMLIQMMAGTNVTDTLAHESIQDDLLEHAVRHGGSRLVAYVKPEIWVHFRDKTNYVEEFVVVSYKGD